MEGSSPSEPSGSPDSRGPVSESRRPDRRDGPLVEPIPGEPAATAPIGDALALLIADYHAGYESALRYERGVDVPSRADERRDRLLALLERTGAERLVVCGDLMHSIGDPGGAERGELEVLFESLPTSLSVTVVKGNHDGGIDDWLATEADIPTDECPTIEVVPGGGVALDRIGVCHGHTWPSTDALECDVLCLGHEHPCVRLEDEVGGSRVERVWLRGRAEPGPFRPRPEYEALPWLAGECPPRIVVLPAFNALVGGTWVNLPDQSFLSPFLPAGLTGGEAYLLDGTRLGPYRSA